MTWRRSWNNGSLPLTWPILFTPPCGFRTYNENTSWTWYLSGVVMALVQQWHLLSSTFIGVLRVYSGKSPATQHKNPAGTPEPCSVLHGEPHRSTGQALAQSLPQGSLWPGHKCSTPSHVSILFSTQLYSTFPGISSSWKLGLRSCLDCVYKKNRAARQRWCMPLTPPFM